MIDLEIAILPAHVVLVTCKQLVLVLEILAWLDLRLQFCHCVSRLLLVSSLRLYLRYLCDWT